MAKKWIRCGLAALVLTACEVAPYAPEAVRPVVTPSVAPTSPLEPSPARIRRNCFGPVRDPIDLEPAPRADDGWQGELEELIAGRDISVSVALGRRLLFNHQGQVPRTPASNQKLLLSMAMLDAFPAGSRVATAITSDKDFTDLYVRGTGDPTVGDEAYRATLGLTGSTIDRLAQQVAELGIERIPGRVIGTRGPLRGDWDAPGWKPYVQEGYITRPTALSYNGNASARPAPQRQVATRVRDRLEELGVEIGNRVMKLPTRKDRWLTMAVVLSPTLIRQIEIMGHDSSNFIAEVLNQRLGAKCFRTPGTIAKGARATERWARMHGVRVVANDAAGLSYDNRMTTRGLVTLLANTSLRPWGDRFRRALPGPGEGTLAGRLAGVQVRAKTGSLFNGTASLSGWVWLAQANRWSAFSIMSSLGSAAIPLEDEIVRLLAARATPR
jgi:D-alanyl-D-alanine carboxypeptidase/D-alanyl-D-alanine-endopeptidase (penicillin-binding protein 4)